MYDDSAAAYALKNTKVLYLPERRIDSFGDTSYNFIILTEPLDAVGHCRVRTGKVEATRPRILRPSGMYDVEMEGFSTEARQFMEWMRSQGAAIQALVKYGFTIARTAVQEEYLHENICEVRDRVVRDAESSGDCLRVVLTGIDDAWELSLLCFMIEMIQQSHEINIFDFKRRGLL